MRNCKKFNYITLFNYKRNISEKFNYICAPVLTWVDQFYTLYNSGQYVYSAGLTLDIWAKCWFLTKISIFDPNFDIWPKCWFLTKISIFDPNFDIWPKCWLLTKISIFDPNFDIWPKCWFLTKISIFAQNFDFRPKFRFLPKMFIFWPKCLFFYLNVDLTIYF